MTEKQIKHCAITGADNWVSYNDINRISRQYSFAEWAMLLSPEEFNLPYAHAERRFPTREWMQRFFENCPDARRTVHLCSSMLQKFIEKDPEPLDLLSHVHGIQLNFKFRNGGKFLLSDDNALKNLVRRVGDFPHEVILQYGGEYKVLVDAFKGLENVSLLVDGSAGSGQLPEIWPANHADFPTGFAGGLMPGIVAREIAKMFEKLPEGYIITRVDAESGYRILDWSDTAHLIRDEFSIEKAEWMCREVEPFIAELAKRRGLFISPEGRHFCIDLKP